ncbi:Major facilitator superfamily, general substrate transporter [Penicillium camemberti]|uniref:Major facilitator superfamily, general substrate transporter n=1 Tax=Penicillium camemberti (strain FM 013) TaxID=1429867 RepID=A0A0G4P2M9_PENC3|nr:Major facilitator superfamily, general substrate transporter [Penicillium camemberti]
MPQAARWAGTPSIKGRNESTRMALLTFSLVGLQFTWGTEMTYCTPYLLQLGLTKSKTSLVWIAGPLSGLIIQPLIGVIADRSRSKWGRRRPFMVYGSLVVAFCLLVLGWTKEIVGLFVKDPEKAKNGTIALAVVSIYAVDFSINVVQACCRGLIVDTLPIPSQQAGSAWAGRMSAIGQLFAYVVGAIDTVSIFGTFLGDTQFKQMTVIAALSLMVAVAITSYSVKERVLISARDDGSAGAIQVLSQLFKTTFELPPRIQAICWAQFWAWIGWFPFLFYSTTWVGETYFRYEVPKDDMAKATDMLGEVGRVGSLSLTVFSSITVLSSVLLPFCIMQPDTKRTRFTARPPPKVAAVLKAITAIRPDLQTAWLISHIMFAATMIFAPLAHSRAFATFLVAVCGIPWAISGWAPFAFMGVEINKLTMGGYSPAIPSSRSGVTMITSASIRNNAADTELDVLRLNHHDSTDSDTDEEEHASNIPSTGELAGIYLGVLNVYTTLPQFVGTFISWIVFSILEPGAEPTSDNNSDSWMNLDKDRYNAISICLFIGAISALVAAEATRRLRYIL